MADQDAVVVVVQVVAAQHVEVPPHRRHDVVNPPLQHGAVGQPLVLSAGGGGGGGGGGGRGVGGVRRGDQVEEGKADGMNGRRDGRI